MANFKMAKKARFMSLIFILAICSALFVPNPHSSKAEVPDRIAEFTLHHSRPESQTRWRIPSSYLSRAFEWQEKPTRIILIDATLPEMGPWDYGELNPLSEADRKRRVSITINASFDFATEKRLIPKLSEDEWELIGDYHENFLRYRQVQKNNKGETTNIINVSWFYLVPKNQVAGRAIFFRCIRVCIARADFSETVGMKYDIDLSLIDDWLTVDQKVRNLLASFIVR